MITHADLPRELNLATWFVDRNVEEGRGDRIALISPAGETTYADLARLVNRCGNLLRELGVRAEERVLLALGDSVEFVALWYGAQKIGAVTAEAYTFLQPKDYAYYLEYTDAAVVVADETTEAAIRAVAGERQRPGRRRAFRERLAAQPDELEPGADDEGRHRALEVHDRQHGAAERRRPSRAQPRAQLRVVRARRARDPRGRRRAAGAEALLRLRARPDRPLPVRRRRRGSSSRSARRRSGSSS